MRPAASVVSFADFVFHHALAWPAKPAIILPDRVVTYGMFAQGVLRAEHRIRALGLTSGALVCVSIDSPIRTMVLAAALFRLGHPIVVTAQPDDCAALRLPVGAILHKAGVSLIPGQRQAVVDDGWFDGERQPITAVPARGFADDQDICCVALSSGTTGRPKAISLTAKSFQQRQTNFFSIIGLGAWQRLLVLPGLATSWGFSVAAHALSAGRTLLFAENARESLHMISVYAADALVITTSQLREVVREQMQNPLPCTSLRTVVTGGGLLSPAVIAEARTSLCSSVIAQYGATETGPTAFAPADQVGGIAGAAGFVAPWAEMEIVDEAGKVLPPATDGILRIRTSYHGAHYPPGADSPGFREGWFYSGDLGRITPGGLLIITGRTSDVINVGGLKLAPELIEEILRGHPAVTDVAAFGGMGEAGIEEISVALVANTSVADTHLIDFCAERGVPLSRVFIVEELPKAPSGKIRRELLKSRLLGSVPKT
jgi:acyl-coenzyme A synthetase/AMP-(fatty) acid ligase